MASLLVLWGGVSDASVPAGVRVVSSDERSLVFEYVPAFRQVQSIASFSQYDFEGSEASNVLESIGEPDLRFHRFDLGFPGEHGNVVRIVAADYEDIRGVKVSPIPSYKIDSGSAVVDKYIPSPTSYFRSTFTPENIASIEGVGRSRDMFLGTVKVYPMQYNPLTQVLRKYSRIVVEVSYGGVEGTYTQSRDNHVFKNVLLNYNFAQHWTTRPTSAIVSAIPQSSVLAVGDWYKMTVTEEGIYRLSRADLASYGINVSSLNPLEVKIFGNGGEDIPESPLAARPVDLEEVATHIQTLSGGDFFVYFYGKPAKGWKYNPTSQRLEHYINHYSNVNYYWLTVGPGQGKRMQMQSSLPDNPTITPDRFLDGVFVEQELANLMGSGKLWMGQSFLPGGSFTYANSLPGIIPSDNILYRFMLAARSNPASSFTVSEGATQIGVFSLPFVPYNATLFATRNEYSVRGIFPIAGSASQLTFRYSSSSAGASGWIDWFEIQYSRRLEAANNNLRFRSPDADGVAEYSLQMFSGMPLIFNVSDHWNAQLINVTTPVFRDSVRTGTLSEYCAVGEGGFKRPAGVVRVSNQNMRGFGAPPDSGADFIIVTSKEFMGPAQRLKAHRDSPEGGNHRTYIADIDLIYNEFGGGISDISAVRDFLKYAYEQWQIPPQFVLMFGGASYDYKGILGSKSSYVPTWQSEISLADIESYSTDDFFFAFYSDYPSFRPSVAGGRIPSRQLSEADMLVSKLIRYDRGATVDPWKTRIIFVGDDGWTTEGDDLTIHSQQAETLANSYTGDEFEKIKIYIAEYPTIQTAQGRRKPAAYQAIIDAINHGAVITNFIGHGNPAVWAHENVFNVSTSIPQLVNENRLSVFYAATCNFSQFDDPQRLTGSELLINKPDGAGIASVSATRKVYSGANAYFHQNVFARMFTRDGFGRLVVERPATAQFLFKASFSNSDKNDQKFVFMGDPSMRLQVPVRYGSIDSVNSQALDAPGSAVQLQALAKVTLQGSIRDQNNNVDSSFNGRNTLVVNDASRPVTIFNFSPGLNWTYLATGSTIFRGENSVSNGHFTATFIVPKDISYTNANGRLLGYFSGDGTDGIAFSKNVVIGGTNDSAAADVNGPSIQMYVDSRSFRPGDLVKEKPQLIVDLSDSSGINTSIAGIGHRIEAWVNNSPQSLDLTDYYVSTLDDYRSGTVQYDLQSLPQGTNEVRIRAWDTYNNSATAQTFFKVTSTDKLTIADVFNYPNPFSVSTSFTFRQNQLTPLDVTVKVYTIAGRLIQTLTAVSPGEPFVRVPWDGRDRDGDILGNGVYLYKIIVRTSDGRFSSEALGKLTVLK